MSEAFGVFICKQMWGWLCSVFCFSTRKLCSQDDTGKQPLRQLYHVLSAVLGRGTWCLHPHLASRLMPALPSRLVAADPVRTLIPLSNWTWCSYKEQGDFFASTVHGCRSQLRSLSQALRALEREGINLYSKPAGTSSSTYLMKPLCHCGSLSGGSCDVSLPGLSLAFSLFLTEPVQALQD